MLVSSYFQGNQKQKAPLRRQGLVSPEVTRRQKGDSSNEARHQILNLVFLHIGFESNVFDV